MQNFIGTWALRQRAIIVIFSLILCGCGVSVNNDSSRSINLYGKEYIPIKAAQIAPSVLSGNLLDNVSYICDCLLTIGNSIDGKRAMTLNDPDQSSAEAAFPGGGLG